ncbi:hypothetical protein HG462_000035 [Candidatus Saccharibacteria bacterium]|nr:hypothetical protein [Candidatus Saccharibacteria bacterium]
MRPSTPLVLMGVASARAAARTASTPVSTTSGAATVSASIGKNLLAGQHILHACC